MSTPPPPPPPPPCSPGLATPVQSTVEFSGSGSPAAGTDADILFRLVGPRLLWVSLSNADTSATHTAESGWTWENLPAPNLNCGTGFTNGCGLWAPGEPRSGKCATLSFLFLWGRRYSRARSTLLCGPLMMSLKSLLLSSLSPNIASFAVATDTVLFPPSELPCGWCHGWCPQ
jgi:hypothetical protein